MQRTYLAASALFVLSMGVDTAHASEIEKWLIMPGPVVSSHEAFEADCDSCHTRQSGQSQAELCVSCHEAVGTDIADQFGLHGRLPAAESTECSDCHTEHEGRDENITALNVEAFDHANTDFSLHGGHATVDCTSCHLKNSKHREAPAECIGCHRADDVHRNSLGTDCAACHAANRWNSASFNHSATGFALTGGHASPACGACHQDQQFSTAGRSCVDCHRGNDIHRGSNGTECVDCHVVSSWASVTFNHEAVSGFALVGGHRGPNCQACHRGSRTGPTAGRNCEACHRTDDAHDGRLGPACGNCHSASGWSTVRFDHALETAFPLPAGHDALECSACHNEQFEAGVPANCGTCHAAADPHKGQLGHRCESCHAATDWTSSLWFEHDITRFPLLGAHATVACDRCHASARFHDAGTQCQSCHADEDPHRGSLGDQCDACHNPLAWSAWQFDHATQTAFPLSGAHSSVECAGCHLVSKPAERTTLTECVACHRRDDPHQGRFGERCDGCHTTSSFSQVEGL